MSWSCVADDWLVTGTTVPPLFVITVVPVITFVVPTVAQASTLALMVVVVVLTEDLVGANPVVPPFCFSKLDFVGAVAPSPAVALLGFEREFCLYSKHLQLDSWLPSLRTQISRKVWTLELGQEQRPSATHMTATMVYSLAG